MANENEKSSVTVHSQQYFEQYFQIQHLKRFLKKVTDRLPHHNYTDV